MAGYTQVFGGSAIYPSQTSYLALTLTEDVELNWPVEQQIGGSDIVADIMDLDASSPGLSVILPDARQATNGFTALFNNVGSQTVTIQSATGATLVSLTSGTAWQLYLTDNSTESGTWRVFQYGASVSVVNAAALAGSGLKAISTTLNQSMPVSGISSTPYVVLDSDRAKVLMWTGGVGGFTLPAPGTVGSDWYVNVRNSGSGDLTLTPTSGNIDAASTLVVSAGGSAIVFTDGTNYYTIGSGDGSSGGSGFDYISIDVAGSGDFTLSGVNLNRIGYNFTGVLTGTRNIIVPGAIQEYWVTNSTTGAFSLFLKTAAQTPGVEILQDNSLILACDGTDVFNANSTTVSFPIPVAQGGTGAVTAAAARTNLGATTVGANVFTAATAADARSAMSAYGLDDTFLANVGSVGAPSYSFNGDTDTGIYRAAANDIRIVAGGLANLQISTTAVSSLVPIQAPNGTVGSPSHSFFNEVDCGMYLVGANDIGLAAGGIRQIGFSTSRIYFGSPLRAPDGSVGTPAYSFDNDTTTGAYRVSANIMGLAAGGTQALQISTTEVISRLPLLHSDGTSGAPSVSFSNDTDTGLYLAFSNDIYTALGGTGNPLGYRNVPVSVQNANYTLVAGDAGKVIVATTPGGITWTIPANASVAYPLGTVLTFVNYAGSSNTIAINTDTLNLAGSGATGSRTLSSYGVATAIKTAGTTWIIMGTGLS